MSRCEARYTSFEHGSASDGAGLRSVLFLHGCNLRCPFCHNPETLYGPPKTIDVDEAAAKLARYAAYLRGGGGLTLSGGEPFLQPEFCKQLAGRVHDMGLTAIAETNGLVADEELISALDGVRLDVKNHSGENGAELISRYRDFLGACKRHGTDVLLTNVVVPGLNDSDAAYAALAELKAWAAFCRGFKFLPFRKLCASKYERMGRAFPLAATREAETEDISRAERMAK